MEPRKKGECEACGNKPRHLTQLDSGQWICRTCLREIRPPRPKHLATPKSIAYLRSMGFSVSDDLARIECERLLSLNALHVSGVTVPYDTPHAELDRLSAIQRLKAHGVAMSDGATLSEAEAVEAQRRRVQHFFTKVVGVTHSNDDGSNRQTIIATCMPAEKLILEHDESNRFDPNAVRVSRMNGQQIGFLREELAEEVVSKSRGGHRYAAFVTQVTGGKGKYLGVNLLMVVAEPGVSEVEAQAYVVGIDFSA